MDTDRILTDAVALHQTGRLDEAAREYGKVLERDGRNADANYGLGTVLMQQGEHRRAAELLNIAVSAQPEVPEFTFNHALVLDELGETERAKAGYLHAAVLSGGQPELLLPICRKLLGVRQPHAALRFLEDSGIRSAEAHLLQARARGMVGDWAIAVGMLREIAADDSDNPRIWREISTAAAHLHDYDTAISAYDTYLRSKTPDGMDLLGYADLLFLAQRLEPAKAALEQAMPSLGEHAGAHYIRAKIARLEGDTALARRHLEQTIELRPTDGDAWGFLLESEPAATLPELAARCRELADGDEGSQHERITLALAAGRAFEKTGDYADAFDCFRTGNERQRADLERRGSGYRPSQVEEKFDRIVALFDQPLPRAPAEPSAPHPVFIVGMPRSGTTLVEKILSCLDGVTAAGEVEAMEFVAADYYHALDQGKTRLPGDLAAMDWQALADEYWSWTGREPSTITDKMLTNFRNVGFIANLFPAAPVIWMRRDPRDVCLSIYSRKFPDGHPYACDPGWLAHFYGQSVRMMRHWQALLPDRVLEMAYEDLVEAPEARTRELADFCGLEWHERCLEFEKKPAASFTFSEMQVRKPLNRAGVGRWRHYGTELAPLVKALTDNGIL